VIMRIVVDLPAPLGPRNPSTSPFRPRRRRRRPRVSARRLAEIFHLDHGRPSKNTYTDRHGAAEVPCRAGGTGFYRNLDPDISK